jgi:hypothetical protein
MIHTLSLVEVRSLIVAYLDDPNFITIALKIEDQPHASYFYRQIRT